MAEAMTPALTSAEIYDLTHYRRPAEQLRALARLGIPAMRRHDNTICVLRAHLSAPLVKPEPARPQLKL
jgi:hypothetical protein